jgi:predicted type IV restriction endonuclease
MEIFQNAVAAIVKALPAWEQRNLNEAQTCQAIILPLLKMAGFDIWNPFEVFPEKNSGGKNSYIPDFTVCFEEKDKFIIEAKALGKELSEGEKVQALNYVNALGLRWAILTNGKQWIFLDNNILEQEAAKKVALVLNLLEPRAGEFLSALLNPSLWKAEDANQRVAEQVQLIKITEELKSILLRDPEFPNDERGVKLAIRYELAAENKAFATKQLTQILDLLFPKNMPLVEMQAAPITQITPQVTEESLNVWQVLYEKLQYVQNKSGGVNLNPTKNFYTVSFGEMKVNLSSLANISEAVAETCLTLKQDNALKFISEQDRNPTMAYRLLSNRQYISVNYSFDAGMAFVKKLFKTLGLPAGSVTITSNDRNKTLP